MFFLPLFDDTPSGRTAIVTYGLILACILAFLWQAGLSARAGEQAIYSYGMIPAVLFGTVKLPAQFRAVAPWETIYTSMFLHGGLVHVAGNMLYLWLFGRGVERALGPIRFVLLYLAAGSVAALGQAFAMPHSTVPMIGASGAIAGVLGAYFVIYPRANVTLFVWIIIVFRIITVPATLLLGLWLLLQIVSGLSATAGEPGVAFWAHVAGFIAGLGLVTALRPRHVTLLQESRSRAFVTRRPGGSVPRAGRSWQSGPWG